VYQTEHLITRLEAPFTLFGWQPAIEITIERTCSPSASLCVFSAWLA